MGFENGRFLCFSSSQMLNAQAGDGFLGQTALSGISWDGMSQHE